MPDVLMVAPLAGGDAMAVRTGDDVVVHVSPTVPPDLHEVIVDDLQRAVRLAGGCDAVVTLPAGGAALLPVGTFRPSPGRAWSAPKAAAAVAALVVPVAGLAGMFLLGDTPRGSSSVTAAPAPPVWPTKPGPHRAPLQAADPVRDARSQLEAQVSPIPIHPPTTITRAVPVTVGEPELPNHPDPASAAPHTPSLSVPVTCPAPPQLLNDPAPGPEPAPKTGQQPAPDAEPKTGQQPDTAPQEPASESKTDTEPPQTEPVEVV